MEPHSIFHAMRLPTIAPPLGLTNVDVLRSVWRGPRWRQSAASAFGVTKGQLRRLIVSGRFTARHYFIMAHALRGQKQTAPLIEAVDIKRAKRRREHTEAESDRVYSGIVWPICLRHRAA